MIVRHLTQDSPDLSPRARVAFEQLDAGVWPSPCPKGCSSRPYKSSNPSASITRPGTDIRNELSAMIRMRGVHVPNKQLYLRARELYATCSVPGIIRQAPG